MNKIQAGFFSFTEILNGNHKGYNEWHQLDHMPEQFPIPGIALGQRWVQTPRCHEARLVAEPLLDPIHYVTLYLMTEPLRQTLAEFTHLGRELRNMGRWFDDRVSHLSGPFMRLHGLAAPRVRVSGDCIPARPNRGIFLAMYEVVDPARARPVPGLAGGPPPAGARGPRRGRPLDLRHRPRRLGRPLLGALRRPGLRALPRRRPRRGHRPPGRVRRRRPLPGREPAEARLVWPFETIVPWQWDWFD